MKKKKTKKKQRDTLKEIENLINKEHLKISPEFVLNFLKYKYWRRLGHKDNKADIEYVTRELNAQYYGGSSKVPLRPIITPPRRKKQLKDTLKPKKKKKEKWTTYEEQLQDPRWFAFREKVFQVRGHKCEKCGSEEIIQVHHPKYITGRKAWEYSTDEVIVLCRKCHREVHGLTEDNNDLKEAI